MTAAPRKKKRPSRFVCICGDPPVCAVRAFTSMVAVAAVIVELPVDNMYRLPRLEAFAVAKTWDQGNR